MGIMSDRIATLCIRNQRKKRPQTSHSVKRFYNSVWVKSCLRKPETSDILNLNPRTPNKMMHEEFLN